MTRNVKLYNLIIVSDNEGNCQIVIRKCRGIHVKFTIKPLIIHEVRNVGTRITGRRADKVYSARNSRQPYRMGSLRNAGAIPGHALPTLQQRRSLGQN